MTIQGEDNHLLHDSRQSNANVFISKINKMTEKYWECNESSTLLISLVSITLDFGDNL